MKLTYRGIAYEKSASLASASEQPKVKLIYRGQTYYAAPHQAVEAVKLDGPTVMLHYRGSSYERRVQPINPSYNPRAINWRYRAAQ